MIGHLAKLLLVGADNFAKLYLVKLVLQILVLVKDVVIEFKFVINSARLDAPPLYHLLLIVICDVLCLTCHRCLDFE